MIHEIVEHGDLTDIAFIERTLDTKLGVDPEWNGSGLSNPNIIHLNSEQMLGSKIHLQLTILKAKSQQSKLGYDANLAVGSRTDLFSDCLHVTPSYFSHSFGGSFLGRPIGARMPTVSETQFKCAPGRNHTHLCVIFTYNFNQNLVTGVGISQQP